MLLDDHGVAGEFADFLVGEAEQLAIGNRDIDELDGLAERLVGRVDHFLGLGTDGAAQHGRAAGFQRRLVDVEFVRIHRALDHRLTQAVARCHEHRVTETGFGVHREQHAGCAFVRAHHALDTGGQRHLRVLEALMIAIGDGAVIEQRGEDFLHRQQHVVHAVDVEEGFLLAGERSVGKILGGGRRTHRHGDRTAGFVDQRLVGGPDLGFQLGRKRRLDQEFADGLAGLREGLNVIDIQFGEHPVDAIGEPLVGQKFTIGTGCGRKTARHLHPGLRQMLDHFSEGGILAADDFHVGHAKFLEPQYVCFFHSRPRKLKTAKNGQRRIPKTYIKQLL